MNLEGVKNAIASIDGAPATAGQPTEEQVRALARSGIRLLVNLGLADADYSLPDEAALAESLGMTYHHLPVAFDSPSLEDLAGFFALLDGRACDAILVHCAANYRATCFVALYAEQCLGWSRAQADAYIALVWTPDPVWEAFLFAARQEMPSWIGPLRSD